MPISGFAVKSIVAPATLRFNFASTLIDSAATDCPARSILCLFCAAVCALLAMIFCSLILIPPASPCILTEYVIVTFFHDAGMSKSTSIPPSPILHSSTPLLERLFNESIFLLGIVISGIVKVEPIFFTTFNWCSFSMLIFATKTRTGYTSLLVKEIFISFVLNSKPPEGIAISALPFEK